MHHHPPLSFVHFAIHYSIGHHSVSYNARRMDEAQPRWLGLPRDLGTDQVSCLPATAHRGTTQGFPSRVHHGILSSSHPGYGAHSVAKNHISPVHFSIRHAVPLYPCPRQQSTNICSGFWLVYAYTEIPCFIY